MKTIFVFVPLIISLIINFDYFTVHAEKSDPFSSTEGIITHDPNLKVELVVNNLDFPTSMAFIGPDDFLILEKNTVRLSS